MIDSTNETYGVCVEVAICDVFDIEIDDDYRNRGDEEIIDNLIPIIDDAFYDYNVPNVSEYTGYSQNPVDFILENGDTLSVKSNIDAIGKASPQVIGQATANTWYDYFYDFVDYNWPNDYEKQSEIFKDTVLKYPADLLREYFIHIFECDWILIVYNIRNTMGKNAEAIFLGKYSYPTWTNKDFSFTRTDDWNESTTVKYRGKSIGEFQVHSNRNCFKFRFNMKAIQELIEANEIDFETY